MKGTKLDFYKANLTNKAKLFLKKPRYILFYIDRFRKYFSTKPFEAFIISYPKSGRTWLQKMMIEAVKLHKDIEINLADISALNDSVEDFPTMLSTHAGSSWEEVVKDAEQIKTEDYKQYKHGRIIYLYRDPRDVLVSQYYHILHRSGYASFDKAYLIDNPNVGLLKIINFMNKWAAYTQSYPEVIYPVSYEQLKTDPVTKLSAQLRHINYPIEGNLVQSAVDNCTLERMRKSESSRADNPWSNTTNTDNNPNSFHSRKGITGEYKEFFSPKEIEHINELIGKHLDGYYSQYI